MMFILIYIGQSKNEPDTKGPSLRVRDGQGLWREAMELGAPCLREECRRANRTRADLSVL